MMEDPSRPRSNSPAGGNDEDTTSLTTVYQEGLVKMACRAATVYRWVYDTFVSNQTDNPGRALCATGNSAGASLIAYALSEYREGDGARPSTGGTRILDDAVMSSGPVFAKLYDGCTGHAFDPAQISKYAYRSSAIAGLDTAFGEKKGSGPCTAADNGGTSYTASTSCNPSCETNIPTLMDANDQDHDGANTVFTYSTKISMLSAQECSPNNNPLECDLVNGVLPDNMNPMTVPPGCAVGQNCVVKGDESHGALASADIYDSFVGVTRKTVNGQQHDFHARPAGAKAIRDELLMNCIRVP